MVHRILNYLSLIHALQYYQKIMIILTNIFLFQHDGAPPYFALPLRQFSRPLDRQKRAGQMMEWLRLSSDLTTLNFFLWNILKLKRMLLNKNLWMIYDIQKRINVHSYNISEAFHNRLYYCVEVNGNHFEQLR